MAYISSPARNEARRLKHLHDRAAAAGLSPEEYAAHRAAALRARETAKAQKAAARAASAARGLQRARQASAAASAARKRQTVEATPQPAKARGWLVENIVRAGDLVVLDGDAAATLAIGLDLAIAISAGLPSWAGRPIEARGTKALFLDLCFTLDIGSRIRVTELMRQIETGDRLRISRGGLLVGNKMSSAAFLAGVQETGAPGLIAINGFHALCAASGISPDDSKSMSLMLDGLTSIQARLGGPAVLLLGGADTALGAVADRIFHVRRDGRAVTMRAADDGTRPLQFRLVPVRGTVIPVPVDPAVSSKGTSS